jgi:outer membrane receptor protein involved in Fe transport
MMQQALRPSALVPRGFDVESAVCDGATFPKLPSYAVFNIHTSYQVTKNLQIYGRVANIFDNRYSTLGTFFDREALPNFTNGGAEFSDPRSLSPARPRAFYAGMRVTF